MTKNVKGGAIADGYRPLGLLHVSHAQDLPATQGSTEGSPMAEPGSGTAPGGHSGNGHEHREPAELAVLTRAVADLTAAVEREHERAAHREAIIDRLHEDNQTLRRGETQALFEPVRAALYRLHDLTRRESESWAGPVPPDPAHAAQLLTAVADEIAEALARTGVERFTVRPGERFDAARHRPVATEVIAEPELDGTVVRSRADGFEQGGKVVRKAEVSVGRLAQPPEDPAPHPGQD